MKALTVKWRGKRWSRMKFDLPHFTRRAFVLDTACILMHILDMMRMNGHLYEVSSGILIHNSTDPINPLWLKYILNHYFTGIYWLCTIKKGISMRITHRNINPLIHLSINLLDPHSSWGCQGKWLTLPSINSYNWNAPGQSSQSSITPLEVLSGRQQRLWL